MIAIPFDASSVPQPNPFSKVAAGALILAVILAPWRTAEATELNVVATIKPVHSLVSQVLEGISKPALLVDGAASPHSFALKPSDARALNGADVFVRVSPSVEPFTRKIVEALPKSVTVVTLEDADGVSLLETRTAATFDDHDHSAGKGQDHKTHGHKGHSHGKKSDAAKHDDHDEHEHGGKDGHIWLDPENARAIVRKVAAVLAERQPELKQRLEANAAKALAGIDVVDAELKTALQPYAGRPFIVFHDAYQYLERRYGLTAAGSISLNPEVKPSAKRLSAVRAKIKSLDAACVFAEPQFSPKIIASVVEGSNARAGILDPIGAKLTNGPELYGALMRDLARGFSECMTPRS